MVEIIHNRTKSKHALIINKALNTAIEVSFAIAFFKMSGLNIIRKNLEKAIRRGAKVNMVLGLDYGFTDPAALKVIFRLLKKHSGCNLYLAGSAGTFHPKVYFFKSKNKHVIISGSANCTSGGLSTNEEVSLVVEAQRKDPIVAGMTKYFEQLVKEDFVKKATELSISTYESFYNQQKEARKRTRQSPEPSDINFEKLREHYKLYLEDWPDGEDVQWRLTNYRHARRILNDFASDRKIGKTEFRSLYSKLVGGRDLDKLWHSGSIFRHKERTITDRKRFRDLVRLIKNNKGKRAGKVFDLGLGFKVDGVGPNIMTEIMMTYNWKKFGNVNRNPITALKEAGCYLRNSSSFRGEDYDNYCELLKEICVEMDMDTMLEIDSFFNDIYWRVKDNYS